MVGLRKWIPAASIICVTLISGSMAAVLAPLVPAAWAQTPEQARALKAYEAHLRRMDAAEKSREAKPAAPDPLATPAVPQATAPSGIVKPPPPAPARTAMSAAEQDTATERGLEQYRRMMKDDPWSNPALLDADRGEAMWTERRGKGRVSLAEVCDLGKGVGVVEGAFAEMPRYFADADRVQDSETRILWCMEHYQDFDGAAFRKSPHPSGGQPVKDIGAIATYVASKAAGLKIASRAEHPKEKAAIALGEQLFFRRQGPFDFSCATCHAETGKRIRLQPLPFLSEPKEASVVIGEWPAYRVSSTHVMTMQHRLLDCYWQMRLHRLDFGSDVSVALSAYLYDRARGGNMAAPGLKR